MNPWLAYLGAGRQALRQALIEVQVALPEQTHATREEALACLEQVMDHIARREIELFCSVCQSRPKAAAPAGAPPHSHHSHH